MANAAQSAAGRPLIMGEVLFDCFPDGHAVLGGAPFNIAWHLQGFGMNPYFVSRVGEDAHGRQIREAMAQWGMDTAGLQSDGEHPTGVVQIELQEGQPSYDIVPDQAYDFAEPPAVSRADFHLLYHGSLFMRSPVSRAAVQALRETDLPAFVDINLRTPWWNLEVVESAFRGARWVKLNDEELGELAEGMEIAGGALEDMARRMRDRYKLEAILVTEGAKGAFMLGPEGELHRVRPSGTIKVVDAVGAGDAFTSVTLTGLMQGWEPQALLNRAQSFAEAICVIRGATTTDTSLYQRHRSRWGD